VSEVVKLQVGRSIAHTRHRACSPSTSACGRAGVPQAGPVDTTDPVMDFSIYQLHTLTANVNP
jgi:hypothetical protein